jgi:DNA-binding NarL/FixJ family response regulator
MSDLDKPDLGHSPGRPLKLLLIEPDPIYRAGLRLVLEKFSDLQVVAEAENSTTALQNLTELASNTTRLTSLAVDLVLLGLHLGNSYSSQLLGLQLCRQLKTQYPNLPVLLLSSPLEPTQLAAAQQAGVNGYCPKGIPVAELVAAIRQVAAGRSHWIEVSSERLEARSFSPPAVFARLRDRLRLSGLEQIDASLSQVTQQLQVPGLTLLERAMLAGQRRELLASRWLVKQMLAVPESSRQEAGASSQEDNSTRRQADKGSINLSFSPSPHRPIAPSGFQPSPPQLALSANALPATLFASTRAKLQSSLENLTYVPLEIDIFREDKKRELLLLILQKIEDILVELRSSQVHSSQLPEMHSVILRDLWQAATIEFFGRYYTLQVGERRLEIVNTLLRDAVVVQTAILDKIPLVVDLFSYLLFATPLVIDNVLYPASSVEAKERAEITLQNLLIQLGNAVVQPLLNHFADVENIKQIYYDRSLISTREIERFRNNLSWKYRQENSFIEPKRIFESRYEMFIFATRGFAKISVYAPRTQELKQLSGIGLVVTLALEIRDAIAPRLRAIVAFLGTGIVYVLSQVVGRAIGLIGRGILQGLGGSLQESKNKKF